MVAPYAPAVRKIARSPLATVSMSRAMANVSPVSHTGPAMLAVIRSPVGVTASAHSWSSRAVALAHTAANPTRSTLFDLVRERVSQTLDRVSAGDFVAVSMEERVQGR